MIRTIWMYRGEKFFKGKEYYIIICSLEDDGILRIKASTHNKFLAGSFHNPNRFRKPDKVLELDLDEEDFELWLRLNY